jgi:Domain of unknown function (DUF4265)
MKTEARHTQAAIRVAAPVDDPDIPIFREVMDALPDVAHPDQAVVLNVPFLVDGLNYGDLVRLGPEDEIGVRPIVEVLVASGHVHLLAATEDDEAHELIAHLERNFPAYALRIEGAHGHLVSVSVHPDLDPDEVRASIESWLGSVLRDQEEGLAVGPPCESEVGPLWWGVEP